MGGAVPIIEVSDDRYGLRVRRPHREMGSVPGRVRAELVIEPDVAAFPEQIDVVLAD
jgi:hypothetical protein